MGAVTFSLEGNVLDFNEKTDLYNSIRAKYVDLGCEAREKASKVYDEHITTISDFRIWTRKYISEVFDEYLREGVLEVIGYGIYDIDDEVLKSEFEADFVCQFKKAISEVQAEIRAIEKTQEAADQARKEMIQAAGSAVSSDGYIETGDLGTDIGNMVTGELENMAINAALAAGTALITGGIRKLEKEQAEKDMENIFRRPTTKQNILIGLEKDVRNLHKTLARLINERHQPVFYYVSEEEKAAIEPVIRNITKGNFARYKADSDLEKHKIEEILEINPYEVRVYSYIMQKNSGLSEEMKNLLGYLKIDMDIVADAYLRTQYDIDECLVYEDIVDVEAKLRAGMEPFGVSECEYLFEALVIKDRLFDIRRSFNGYKYDSIEERDNAEVQFKEFLKDDLEAMDLDELVDKYLDTLAPEYTEKNRQDLQAIVLKKLPPYIEEFLNAEDLAPYINRAEVKKQEGNYEKLSLLDMLNKKRKQLERKAKFAETTAKAREKLKATADFTKNAGKDLMDKLPTDKMHFGSRKDKTEAVPQAIEGNVNAAIPAATAVQTNQPAYGAPAYAQPGNAAPGYVQPGYVAQGYAQPVNAVQASVQPVSDATVAAPQPDAPAKGGFLNGAKGVFSSAADKIKSGTENIKNGEGFKNPFAGNSAASSADAAAGATVETKQCPTCGADIKITSKFCSKCGYHF